MKLVPTLEYGVDYIYLIGGVVVFGMGLHSLFDVAKGELPLHILFGIALIASSIVYLRYAFHLNYPNRYIRISLLLIVCSIYPYVRLESLPEGDDLYGYVFYALSVSATFMILMVSGLVTLLVGYVKGKTNLEQTSASPLTTKF